MLSSTSALPFLRVDVRPHLDEIAFRQITAAHVLEHEDVPRFVESLGRTQPRPELIDAVWRDAVWRPRHQERVAARRILRHVDRREQALAIPRGDVQLVLGVVRLNVERRGRLSARHAHEHGRGETGHRQRDSRLPVHPPAPRRSASASNVNASSLIDPMSGSSSVVTTTMPSSVTVWRRRSSSML